MPAQRVATDPPYLHRQEWFAKQLNKFKPAFAVGSGILSGISPEEELFRQVNLGLIAAQDILTQGATVPTLAAGANAGTTPPAPVLVANSNDTRGGITFGTGTTPAAGTMVNVTFGQAYPTAPFVSLDASTVAAAPLFVYVTAVTTTGFQIALQTAPAASQGNTIYGINYRVN